MEERLLSSAFYNLSMQLHRSAVENRLSTNSAASGSGGVGQGNPSGGQANQQGGQSFLARQRQVQSRGAKGPGISSNDFLEY